MSSGTDLASDQAESTRIVAMIPRKLQLILEASDLKLILRGEN